MVDIHSETARKMKDARAHAIRTQNVWAARRRLTFYQRDRRCTGRAHSWHFKLRWAALTASCVHGHDLRNDLARRFKRIIFTRSVKLLNGLPQLFGIGTNAL